LQEKKDLVRVFTVDDRDTHTKKGQGMKEIMPRATEVMPVATEIIFQPTVVVLGRSLQLAAEQETFNIKRAH
jgi:hypothetical protein